MDENPTPVKVVISAFTVWVATVLLKLGVAVSMVGDRISRRLIVESVLLSNRVLMRLGDPLQADPDSLDDDFLRVLVEGDVIPGGVVDTIPEEWDSDDEQ